MINNRVHRCNYTPLCLAECIPILEYHQKQRQKATAELLQHPSELTEMELLEFDCIFLLLLKAIQLSRAIVKLDALFVLHSRIHGRPT